MRPISRTLFAQIIIGLSDKIRQEQRKRGEFVGIGPEKLQELYKALKKREKESNRDPVMDRAFKAFYLMNDLGQTALCFKLYEPVGLVELYGDVCERLGTEQSPDDITQIVVTSLREGGEEGHATLESLIGKDLLNAVLADEI